MLTAWYSRTRQVDDGLLGYVALVQYDLKLKAFPKSKLLAAWKADIYEFLPTMLKPFGHGGVSWFIPHYIISQRNAVFNNLQWRR